MSDQVALALPPRPVPLAFRLAVFSWSWWESFGLLIEATGPIALWVFVPWTIPVGLIAAILTIGLVRVRKSRVRLRPAEVGQGRRASPAPSWSPWAPTTPA